MFTNKTIPLLTTNSLQLSISLMAVGANQVKPCVGILSSTAKLVQSHLHHMKPSTAQDEYLTPSDALRSPGDGDYLMQCHAVNEFTNRGNADRFG